MMIALAEVPRMAPLADAIREAALYAPRFEVVAVNTKRLTDTQVVTVRRLHARGASPRSLAAQFGVTEKTIEQAI